MDGSGREELGGAPYSVQEITWVLSSKGVGERTFVTKPRKEYECVCRRERVRYKDKVAFTEIRSTCCEEECPPTSQWCR